MMVEIWSDVVCPFCFIGKRKFEKALKEFSHQDHVQIEWRSFELDSEAKTDPSKNLLQLMVEKKGWSLEDTKARFGQVSQMAKEMGLDFDFNKIIPANSFRAHLLIQFAKEHQSADQIEELLFEAYFHEGKNISETDTLLTIAKKAGLDAEKFNSVLEAETFRPQIMSDIKTGSQIGIRGVPFFLINGKYGISGAQPSETILAALNEAWSEFAGSKA